MAVYHNLKYLLSLLRMRLVSLPAMQTLNQTLETLFYDDSRTSCCGLVLLISYCKLPAELQYSVRIVITA